MLDRVRPLAEKGVQSRRICEAFVASALSIFNFGVERLQFCSRVFDLKLPIDAPLFPV